ncbi:hypothetical protein AN218_11600 [Streptomyces nanshensis]|uniref:Uncharacterized protein n=1 Tax=Streptomyces nanshensis TaxID=518642 RepID=A0A1E7L6A5_9ACTN|nr:hypothetical protein AN218_11600 [Streptomyces nanshensis]
MTVNSPRCTLSSWWTAKALFSMISGFGGAALGAIGAIPPPYADPRTDEPAESDSESDSESGSEGGRPA